MASLVTNSSAVARSPIWVPKGNSTVNFNGGFLFFSDCPEPVTDADLADSGKWLNRATVNGNGMVYLWHSNDTGHMIHHGLWIYNPNSFPITVSSTNCGKTNAFGGSDSDAWASYFSGGPNESVTIGANAYGVLFNREIDKINFGLIARITVKTSSGAAASAVLYDLAWTSNTSGAVACAKPNGDEFRRGLGSSYYNTYNFDVLAPTTTDGQAYRIAGSGSDIFGTADLVYITDESGQRTGYLAGNYGQQLDMTMKVKNTFSTTKNFRIFMGTNVGGASFFPLVNMAGVTQRYDWISGGSYVDMIDTGPIAPGATVPVSFFTVVPAVSSTPFVIGARPV